MPFEKLFKTKDSKRDKFFSRVFGIFSEEIVRCWATNNTDAPYVNLGRPTIRRVNEPKPYHTLDFILQNRVNNQIYIAEMKCEMEYDAYRYLTLESPEQLNHHTKPAFKTFLDAAQNPSHYRASVGKNIYEIDGSILVWGRCTQQGRADVMSQCNFADILSMENIIKDLITWQNDDYKNLIHKYEAWCGELFVGLRNLAGQQPTQL